MIEEVEGLLGFLDVCAEEWFEGDVFLNYTCKDGQVIHRQVDAKLMYKLRQWLHSYTAMYYEWENINLCSIPKDSAL